MRTRIRHFRKLRRLTQSDLAERLGTTAATVSRLETADITVSIVWLQRFADAFGVQVSDLIDEREAQTRIPCMGEIGRAGTLSSTPTPDESTVMLDAPARDPIAFRIRENVGIYCAGDLLIADRMAPEHVAMALGRDCFVEIEGEASGFGRFISSDNGCYLLVPPEPGALVRSLPTPDWVAPVVMLIRYF